MVHNTIRVDITSLSNIIKPNWRSSLIKIETRWLDLFASNLQL